MEHLFNILTYGSPTERVSEEEEEDSLKLVIGVHEYYITLLYFTSVSPNRVAI
jgi:hypothetical protein